MGLDWRINSKQGVKVDNIVRCYSYEDILDQVIDASVKDVSKQALTMMAAEGHGYLKYVLYEKLLFSLVTNTLLGGLFKEFGKLIQASQHHLQLAYHMKWPEEWAVMIH